MSVSATNRFTALGHARAGTLRAGHRPWLMAAAAASVLVLGVSGCTGGVNTRGPAPGGGPPSPGATSPGPSASPRGESSPHHGTSSGKTSGRQRPKQNPKPADHTAKPPSDSGAPAAGSYDDTSGTDAKAPKSQAKVLDAMGGAKSGKCVVVGNQTDVRSGRIAMGNFATARQAFKKSNGAAYDADPSFFYVIPESRNLTKVTVTATSASGADKIRFKTDQVEDAAQWKYFPIHMKLTASGTWRFKVVAGGAMGCFQADFTS